MSLRLRHAREDDYVPIISVIDDWWGGRHMADMLPRLFFAHFQDTSFIVDEAETGERVAFLVGILSQSRPGEAYIHFVGVHPDYRRQGLGEQMYTAFFVAAAALGCTRVRCVTAPINKTSIAFHQRMGFEIEPGDSVIDGVAVATNYDGQDHDRVRFVRTLGLSHED